MQIKKPGFYVLNHEQCKIPSNIPQYGIYHCIMELRSIYVMPPPKPGRCTLSFRPILPKGYCRHRNESQFVPESALGTAFISAANGRFLPWLRSAGTCTCFLFPDPAKKGRYQNLPFHILTLIDRSNQPYISRALGCFRRLTSRSVSRLRRNR